MRQAPILALAIALLVSPALAQEDAGHAPTAQAVLALDGFDPVSYFPEGGAEPMPGRATNTITRGSAVFRFVSDESRRLFERQPVRFAPVFGGLDPSALARGERHAGDPHVSSIVGGRLFLFESDTSRESWLADPARGIDAACGAWKSDNGEDLAGELGRLMTRRVDKYDLSKKGLAIDGYDPVAYFPEGGGEPTKGSEKLTFEFGGVTYRFVSEEHRRLFLSNPTRYEPAYGGWCAYAMAKDTYTEPNPKSYEITDGRLFLFYKTVFTDTRTPWVKDEASMTKGADRFWASETGERPRR